MRARVVSAMALLVAAALFAPSATSATCIDYAGELQTTATFSTGYTTYGTIVADGYAYVTHASNSYDYYSSTTIFDIHDPGHIEYVRSISIPQPPGYGPQAYSAVGVGFGRFCGIDHDWIYFFDVSDPAAGVAMLDSMFIAGETAGPRTAMGDGICYLATQSPDELYTLHAIDITGPDPPEVIGSVELPGTVVKMIVHGDHLLVTGDATGLTIVDVSDPLAPSIVSTTALPHVARSLAVDASLALVTGDDHLMLVDITDVSSPAPRGTLAVAGAAGVAVKDDVAFVGTGAIDVIDIADLDAPVAITDLGYPDARLAHPGVWDDTLIGSGLIYGFGQPGGIGVAWKIADPRPSALVSSISIGTGTGSVAVEGDYAYAVDGGGLTVVDVSDPEAPTFHGTYLPDESLRDIEIVGLHAYVSHGDGLYVLGLATAPFISVLGNTDIDVGSGGGIDVQGNLVYVATRDGLAIVDVSSAGNPVLIGSWDERRASDVVVGGDVAYLIDSYQGNLQIIDVGDPTAPVEITNIDTGGGGDLAMSGLTVYVTPWNGIQPVDVSDPSAPVVGTVVAGGGGERPRGMHIVGSILYAASSVGPLVYDITDPNAPIYIGSTNVPSSDAFATGSQVYLVGGDVLSVAEPQCQDATPIDPGGEIAGVSPRPRALLWAFPSPVSSRATVRFLGTGVGAGTLRARVLDVTGRLVDELSLTRGEGGFVGTWDAARTEPGVYFLQVETGAGQVSRRIVRIE